MEHNLRENCSLVTKLTLWCYLSKNPVGRHAKDPPKELNIRYDPSDCPPDIDMQTAESLNCTGAWSPDIHGHYRNPQFAAKKHHWWWTANKVFENLKCTVKPQWACYDYSWARSLYFISLSRRDGKRFKVLHSLTPRAFKIDATAFTNTLNNIEVIENVYQVILLEKQHLDDWFPTHIEVYYKIELEKDEYMIFEYSENNGGWNDPRDKAMCTNMTIRKIKKVLMDMKNEFMDYISEKDP
ncbi:uncharacterized protein LOC119193149 [Manduca sexta]|uniref:uncharacterized protein LOC119193149 n=1 Tax=Manduca sexta TaxID=7130 RepID=UPI00188F8A14|nr:uncharacterized protein LOC119193149 [Manduca sexta]